MSTSSSLDTWYRDFFTGAALDLWRQAKSDDETEQECAFLQEIFEQPGAHLLDVPCGNGRLTMPMARAGYKVTGLDFCQEFLDEAAKRAVSFNFAESVVQIVQGDMRTIPFKKKFDGVFCFGNSFGYFDREGTMQTFESLGASLKVGAKLVLESSMLAETFLVNGAEREWLRVGDMLMLIENHYNPRQSCVQTEYTFIRDGKEERRDAIHWIYTSGEVCSMLVSAGFRVDDMFASLDGEPYIIGAERMILVAEKL